MASSLIESMTIDFDPDEYHDSYREALQEVVAAKVEGREVVQPQPVAAGEEPSSLADALRASLAAAKAGAKKGTPATADAEAAGEADAEAAEDKPAQRRTRKAS
jgi:DNA end-binding protein Ku